MKYYDIPSLVQIEAEMIRRGIEPGIPVEKAIPTEDDADLPPVVAAADRLEGTFRRVWIAAMREVAKAMPMGEIIRAIPSGHAGSVFGQWLKAEMEKKARPGVSATMRAVWLKGAWVGADMLKPLGIQMRAASATISFNVVNAQAVSWAANNSGRLITDVSDDQILAVSTMISGGIQNGRTVDQIARDIRMTIGLRQDQISTLINFRADLEADRVDPAVIDRRFERRASGMLASRARVIARTEVVDAANAGQRGLWNEASHEGLFDRQTARKVWVATPDELECEICEALDGTEVPLDGQFEGPLDGPTAHPSCRCGMNIKFGER
jgi:hypothetical protein